METFSGVVSQIKDVTVGYAFVVSVGRRRKQLEDFKFSVPRFTAGHGVRTTEEQKGHFKPVSTSSSSGSVRRLVSERLDVVSLIREQTHASFWLDF